MKIYTKTAPTHFGAFYIIIREHINLCLLLDDDDVKCTENMLELF